MKKLFSLFFIAFLFSPLLTFAGSKRTDIRNDTYNTIKSYSAGQTIRISNYTRNNNDSVKISGFLKRNNEWVTNVFDGLNDGI